MCRKLLIRVLLLCIVVDFSSNCSAQKPTEFRSRIPTTAPTATTTPSKGTDLRPVLAKMRTQNKLVQGKNLVLEIAARGNSPAIKLYATVNQGKVAKWQGVDADGNNLPTNINTVAKAGGGVKCLVCVNQPDGFNRCYEIDCKDAPKPKPKTATQ